MITLMFWHGGVFKKHPKLGFMEYVGGEGRTYTTDPDKTGWWDLKEMAESCGTYGSGDEILYLVPGKCLDEGLVSLGNGDDVVVLKMLQIAIEFKTIDMFVFHKSNGSKDDDLLIRSSPSSTKPTPSEYNTIQGKISTPLRTSPRNHPQTNQFQSPSRISPRNNTRPIPCQAPLRTSPRNHSKLNQAQTPLRTSPRNHIISDQAIISSPSAQVEVEEDYVELHTGDDESAEEEVREEPENDGVNTSDDEIDGFNASDDEFMEAHEDPKRPGKLTKHGVIMTCSICKSTSHNKRRCPDKDNATQSNPKKQNPTTTPEAAPTHIVNASYDHFIGATQESINFTYEAGVNSEMCANWGKGRGKGGIKRGRGGKENFSRNGNIMKGQQSQATFAQPSKTGKGNKVIKSGLGSRGGKTKAMSRSGKLPCGFGVIIGDDGSPIINEPRRQAANILNNRGINAQVLSSATQASINVSLR